MSKSNKRQRQTGSPDSEGTDSADASPGTSPQDTRPTDHHASLNSSKDAKKKARQSSKEKGMKSPPGAPSVIRLAESAPPSLGRVAAHAEGEYPTFARGDKRLPKTSLSVFFVSKQVAVVNGCPRPTSQESPPLR